MSFWVLLSQSKKGLRAQLEYLDISIAFVIPISRTVIYYNIETVISDNIEIYIDNSWIAYRKHYHQISINMNLLV